MPIEPSRMAYFKNISSKDWLEKYGRQGAWYKTVDYEKFAEEVNKILKLKHATTWLIGKFYIELQQQIQNEVREWDKLYYKDPEKKPEYTGVDTCWDDLYDKGLVLISSRQAKRCKAVCLKTEFEFADLGYKKIKMIDDFVGEDKELKHKISALVKRKEWNEDEVQHSLELFVNNIEEEARAQNLKPKVFREEATERVLKKIENIIDNKLKEEIKISLILRGKDNIIRATNAADAKLINEILPDFISQIKLKALRYKK